GHSGLVGGLAYCPDGKFLASGDPSEFKLWNADTLELIRTVKASAQQLAFTPDSQTLFATTTNDGVNPVHTFRRCDVANQNELPALCVQSPITPAYALHCLSRDGKALFVAPGGPDVSYVRAIDTASGKELFPRRGHVAPLNAVAISPNGRTL